MYNSKQNIRLTPIYVVIISLEPPASRPSFEFVSVRASKRSKKIQKRSWDHWDKADNRNSVRHRDALFRQIYATNTHVCSVMWRHTFKVTYTIFELKNISYCTVRTQYIRKNSYTLSVLVYVICTRYPSLHWLAGSCLDICYARNKVDIVSAPYWSKTRISDIRTSM